jgi:hypothetical protein
MNNKMQILRKIVLAIRTVQDGTAEFYPMHIRCTVEEAREALQSVTRLHPGRGVELSVHDGWVLQPSSDGWGEWVEVPQYCGIEIRPMEVAEGPLHFYDREFGVRGQDPWFRNIQPDWAWVVTPF